MAWLIFGAWWIGGVTGLLSLLRPRVINSEDVLLALLLGLLFGPLPWIAIGAHRIFYAKRESE